MGRNEGSSSNRTSCPYCALPLNHIYEPTTTSKFKILLNKIAQLGIQLALLALFMFFASIPIILVIAPIRSTYLHFTIFSIVEVSSLEQVLISLISLLLLYVVLHNLYVHYKFVSQYMFSVIEQRVRIQHQYKTTHA